MTTEHDPRAWRVATALAHESGLDWVRWAKGETADPRPSTWWCTQCGREGWPDFGTHVPTWSTRAYCRACIAEYVDPTMTASGSPTSVPAPWDTEAYLADCRRRGVEPGPLPSLEWTGPDGFGWKVAAYDGCRVRVDFIDEGEVVASWYSRIDVIEWHEYRTHPRTLVERIANLARVAAEAMR